MLESLTDTYRILDAAGNRTREGLRVIEDFVRFGMNDAHLSRRLKEHRHELADISFGLPAGHLLASRDTLQDVGTAISTPAERSRNTARSSIHQSRNGTSNCGINCTRRKRGSCARICRASDWRISLCISWSPQPTVKTESRRRFNKRLPPVCGSFSLARKNWVTGRG